MIRSLLVLVAACGPSASGVPKSARDEVRQAATRDVLAAAVRDPGKLHQLMRGTVVNGGMRFDDAQCAADFGVPGEVPAERTAAFAGCLARLQLDVSSRLSMLDDVVVLRYAPGFELEARLMSVAAGHQLTWIGFSSRRSGDLDVPTITHDALESLRIAGDRHGPVDPAQTSDFDIASNKLSRAAFTWVKLCIDETGAIAKTDVFETTSSPAAKVLAATTTSWKFRPFVTQGAPLAVCAMVRIAYPADKAPPIETLPLAPPRSKSNRTPVVIADGSTLLERLHVGGNKHIVPDDLTKVEISRAGTGKRSISIKGSFRVCIDESGRVEAVLPLHATGFPDYDAKLLRGIREWAFKPYLVDGSPTPVCTYVRFIYSQR
jgi:hypothetical protein